MPSLLEAALSSARPLTASSFSSSLRQLYSTAASHPPSPSLPAPAKVPHSPDNEELSKKSFLKRFKKNRPLNVCDITSVEWCEKQKEFELLNGESEETKAMKKGRNRHAQLKMESTNLIEGLNPELQVLRIVNSLGIWISKLIQENGIPKESNPISVDQIQVQKGEKTNNPISIDQIQVQKGENTNNPISIDQIQVEKGENTNYPILIDELQIQKDEQKTNPISIDEIQVHKGEKTNNPSLVDQIQIQIQKGEKTKNPPKEAKKKRKRKRKRKVQLMKPIQASASFRVIKREDIRTKSKEETWALKFIDFIIGVNQLLNEGLTRELPVIGIIQGIWVAGKIDEIRIKKYENSNSINPMLIDTKTRVKPTIPTEAQKRNARFQLMCYKYLWDNLIMNEFPSEEFLKYFNLDSKYVLSDMIKEYINSLGFQAKTFGDVLMYFRYTISIIPHSKEELLLRYELQADNSLLEEYTFKYDEIWFKIQIRKSLDFWKGNEEANFVSHEEKWKCKFCKFNSACPKIYHKNWRYVR